MSPAPLTWDVGIVIPAQNEESAIERCIASVLRACAASRRCHGTWIVVVADSCSDGTAHRARRVLADRGEVLDCAVASPGTARRLGVTAVMRHFSEKCPRRVWLANTDADTIVPPAWIEIHLQHADDDVAAVAGIVQLDPHGLREDVKELYNRTYLLPVDGTHPHIHGANLGVRADAYLEVGDGAI